MHACARTARDTAREKPRETARNRAKPPATPIRRIRCILAIAELYSHVTCVQYARFWTSNAVTSERLRITSPTPSAGLTRRQGKAILIQQGPYYRTLRMCSQDSVVEGVDGDDEVSDHQYVSPSMCGVNGTVVEHRVCDWRCVSVIVIRCSNHSHHADPHELMPLEELRATRHALMEPGPGFCCH